MIYFKNNEKYVLKINITNFYQKIYNIFLFNTDCDVISCNFYNITSNHNKVTCDFYDMSLRIDS
jgi:hypothetical protein